MGRTLTMAVLQSVSPDDLDANAPFFSSSHGPAPPDSQVILPPEPF